MSNKNERGYMAIYHDIEEISYGPACGLPAIARVFMCIRHKLLRDGLGQKAIGHSFIMEKTGLTKAQVINSAKKLEASGIIIIKADYRETPQGRIQFYENKYELNPHKFGEDINWYKNNPTVRAYSICGKTGSYSKKGISPGGIKSNTTPGIKSDTRVVSDLIPGEGVTVAELLRKSFPNNPSSKNPINQKPLSKPENKFSRRAKSGNGEMTREEVEAEKNRQLRMLREQELKAGTA